MVHRKHRKHRKHSTYRLTAGRRAALKRLHAGNRRHARHHKRR